MTTNPISCSAWSRKFIYVSLRTDGSQVAIDEAASSHYALKYDGILESCQHTRELQNDAHSVKYLISGLYPSTDTTDGPLPFNSFAAHRQIKFEIPNSVSHVILWTTPRHWWVHFCERRETLGALGPNPSPGCPFVTSCVLWRLVFIWREDGTYLTGQKGHNLESAGSALAVHSALSVQVLIFM